LFWDPWFLTLVLHLLGAAVWVGGHLVLALAVLPAALRARDPAVLLAFEARFERVGLPALLVQVATGLALAWRLVPDLWAWADPGDPLGRTVGVKLLCLAATVALAANARLRVIPRLSPATLPVMAWHIRAVTLLAVLFLIAGASFRIGGLGA
jgi:putative copper export protein